MGQDLPGGTTWGGGGVVLHPWKLAGHWFLGRAMLAPCSVLLPEVEVIPTLLWEPCSPGMWGPLGASPDLCRKMLWSRP